MATRNQEALYELINKELNENSYEVNFNVDLYNSGTNKYYTIDENGQKHRFVPTMITDVVGEYLNVPNANSTSNEVGISFDILVDKQGELSDKDITELENVGYNNTLNAIEEFKNSFLAKYFPLGTPYLYMGGEDSTMNIQTNSTASPRVFYLEFTPKNTDTETIFKFDTRYLQKTSTNLEFYIGISAFNVSIPYTVNEAVKIVIYHNGTEWIIEDNNGNTDNYTTPFSVQTATRLDVGAGVGATDTGLEAIIRRISHDSSTITSFDFDNVDIELLDFEVDIKEWNSKTEPTNSGSLTLDTSSIINNSILWSDDGNAIFGFSTLNPVSNIRLVDGLYYYQEFELEATIFISNDVLFGNNFEYYLDGEQVYPIDRQHSLATENNNVQYYNTNYNVGVVEESVREHTLSFYYIPNKKLTSILKHVVTGDTPQNTTYELVVQYPFFKVTYDVTLESGGTEPNINTLSTFTVVLKRKDSNLE